MSGQADGSFVSFGGVVNLGETRELTGTTGNPVEQDIYELSANMVCKTTSEDIMPAWNIAMNHDAHLRQRLAPSAPTANQLHAPVLEDAHTQINTNAKLQRSPLYVNFMLLLRRRVQAYCRDPTSASLAAINKVLLALPAASDCTEPDIEELMGTTAFLTSLLALSVYDKHILVLETSLKYAAGTAEEHRVCCKERDALEAVLLEQAPRCGPHLLAAIARFMDAHRDESQDCLRSIRVNLMVAVQSRRAANVVETAAAAKDIKVAAECLLPWLVAQIDGKLTRAGQQSLLGSMDKLPPSFVAAAVLLLDVLELLSRLSDRCKVLGTLQGSVLSLRSGNCIDHTQLASLLTVMCSHVVLLPVMLGESTVWIASSKSMRPELAAVVVSIHHQELLRLAGEHERSLDALLQGQQEQRQAVEVEHQREMLRNQREMQRAQQEHHQASMLRQEQHRQQAQAIQLQRQSALQLAIEQNDDAMADIGQLTLQLEGDNEQLRGHVAVLEARWEALNARKRELQANQKKLGSPCKRHRRV